MSSGWIPCAIGSDPTTGLCSPFSKDFNCVIGQDCYYVTNYTPLSEECDKTTFGGGKGPICDTQQNQVTYQKCTDWRNNDPGSCSSSTKTPKNVLGYMSCAIGSDPTTTSCSPFTTNNSCKLGQDCYVFTQFDKSSSKCKNIWDAPKQQCDSKGSQMTWQRCTNWANNDVKSCLDDPNKPAGIIGWIPCAIGSDPSKTTCSPYSTDFNCKWGQECYGVTQYAKFPNNGSCDTTTFEDTKKICDSKAGSMTYKKCTNWFGNDPKSCMNTLKPK